MQGSKLVILAIFSPVLLVVLLVGMVSCASRGSDAERDFMSQMQEEYRTTYHWLAPMVDSISEDAEAFYALNKRWPKDEPELYPKGYMTIKLSSSLTLERVYTSEFELKRIHVNGDGIQFRLTCRTVKDRPIFVEVPVVNDK